MINDSMIDDICCGSGADHTLRNAISTLLLSVSDGTYINTGSHLLHLSGDGASATAESASMEPAVATSEQEPIPDEIRLSSGLGTEGARLANELTTGRNAPDIERGLHEPAKGMGLQHLLPEQLDQESFVEIGRGAFGTVFRSTLRGKAVAIKRFYIEDLSLKDSIQKDFHSEALIHAGLHHPHIVSLIGVSMMPRQMFLVMEFIPNGSLWSLLHNSGKEVDWPTRLRIAQQITSGLAYLHNHGIIHQDLKSLNVLLDSENNAHLCDFGVSAVKTSTATASIRPEGEHVGRSAEDTFVGSVRWIAPEVLRVARDPSRASDIYSLGMTFWEIATRKLPFETLKHDPAVVAHVRDGGQESIPDDVPKPFAELIQSCWLPNPSLRPKAEDVLDRLVAMG